MDSKVRARPHPHLLALGEGLARALRQGLRPVMWLLAIPLFIVRMSRCGTLHVQAVKQRPLHLAASRRQSHVLWLGVAASILAACSSTGKGEPAPGSVVPQTSSASGVPTAFHGYRLDVAPGWDARPAAGEWIRGQRPDDYVPGFDTLKPAANFSGLLAIGQRRVAAGTTPQAWLASLRREGSLTYQDCGGTMSKPKIGKLGGENALEISFPCPGYDVNIELLFAVHAKTGWAVLCAADQTSAVPLHVQCSRWLGSFRYA